MFFNKKRPLTKQLIIDDCLLRERIASTADECEALELLTREGFKKYDAADLRIIATRAFEELFYEGFLGLDPSTYLQPSENSLSSEEKSALINARRSKSMAEKLQQVPCWLRSEFDFSDFS